jgi:hypothetical protein
LEDFLKNIQNRFDSSAIAEITEDCIRYDFFVSLLPTINTHNIILEYPNSKEEIDCVIKCNDIIEVAMEFKFFRPIPSGKNSPMTQLLGKLVNDIYRLLHFEANTRKIIVVTDNKMKKYINNELGLFGDNEDIKITKEELDKKAKTFQENIKPYKY